MSRAGCGAHTRWVAQRMQPTPLRAAADPLGAIRLGVRSLAVLSFVLVAFFMSAPAIAQSEEGWGYALSNELMSPWCPGFSLPDCSSGYAQDLRMWILEQERLGRPEADVKAEILARYGEKMLQAPEAKGRGVLAYVIPGVVIALGLALIVTFLRRQGTPAQVPAAADASALSRVDAELAEYERKNPSA
ncbi:MAG: cytochrome c-type biogenesis protein CcmH [Deltaproteobacteria bacterium]|nr:cytochrome c-type biogenesis protein CcmH [Deltaproteobacteria bacterium]